MIGFRVKEKRIIFAFTSFCSQNIVESINSFLEDKYHSLIIHTYSI
jgi:hypothetical protein